VNRFIRTTLALALAVGSAATLAQSDERVLDAERRALEAEGRAVEAERRSLESERRALEADRDASTGSIQSPKELGPEACQRATSQYERICSAPSRDSIGDTPECAAAQAEKRQRCGG
jgi:hypothetical protein